MSSWKKGAVIGDKLMEETESTKQKTYKALIGMFSIFLTLFGIFLSINSIAWDNFFRYLFRLLPLGHILPIPLIGIFPASIYLTLNKILLGVKFKDGFKEAILVFFLIYLSMIGYVLILISTPSPM